MTPETRKRIATPYLWTVIVAGAVAGLYAVVNLRTSELGFGYLVLAAVTLGFGSRIIVQIPHCKGKISVSDTFILLSLLIYGVEASVILAGVDALASSLRVNKKKLLIAYNSAVFFCSTLATGLAARSLFGSVQDLTAREFSPEFLMLLTIMGVVQYAVNSGLVAGAVALRAGQPIWETWH